jgi:hypothetical protein
MNQSSNAGLTNLGQQILNASNKVAAAVLKQAQSGNSARPFTVFKTRYYTSANGAAAAQKVGFTGNNTLATGGIYAPYVPLQYKSLDEFMADTTCVTCGSPGKPVAVQGKNDIRDITLCETCQKTLNIMDWIFRGDLNTLFPHPNPREDSGDNIVWRVPMGTKVFPVYSHVDIHTNENMFYVPKNGAIAMTRDYFCHDSMLFKDTSVVIRSFRGGYGLARGEELYVYQFHKVVYDGTGWCVGFVLDGKFLLAHDVEMTDDESE